MHLIISINVSKLITGLYNSGFLIMEVNGAEVINTPYFLEQQFDNEEQAIRHAENSALDYIHENYPKGTKYRIDKK